MMQVSARVGTHKSVKMVSVDLVMGNSCGTYISDDDDDDGLAFARVRFLVLVGLATSEERSSSMAAGSILSIGSLTRFRIMWTRNRHVCERVFLRRVRRRSVGGGFYFFGERVEVLLFFYKITTNILHKVFIGFVS